jgi:glycosyltransferase involved in cell wall biosynthesis
MTKRIIYLWVGASNPHNSIFIQVQLVSKILADKFNVVTEILHPNVHNIRSKLNQIREAGGIVFWHYGGFDKYLLSYRNKSNIVLIYHNITPASFFWKTQPLVALRSIVGRMQLAIFGNSLKLITMSPYNGQNLYEYGFKNISVCPNIITVSSQVYKAKTKTISLLYVGRISPNKNCISLLQEVEKVANYFKAPVELTVVGSVKRGCLHGIQFQKKYTELFGHPWLKVTWARNVSLSELHNLYWQSWLYISMSLHEGFGVPACESIIHGTPALYIECGGQESILDRKGMVPLNDINRFSDYIIKYVMNHTDRKELQIDQFNIVKNYVSPAVDQQIYDTYHRFFNE